MRLAQTLPRSPIRNPLSVFAFVKTYTNPVYPYRRCADQDRAGARHPVVIVGAGPVGLTLALDLAAHGTDALIVDDDDTVSVGSRAICYAKRSLDILDRLGVAQRIVDKGVGWNVGKVFFGDSLAYRFDLLPEAGHRRPAFVNLQQYWLEQFLVERAAELPAIELRWTRCGLAAHAWSSTSKRPRDRTRWRPTGSSSATARAAPCAGCSDSRRKGRCSATGS